MNMESNHILHILLLLHVQAMCKWHFPKQSYEVWNRHWILRHFTSFQWSINANTSIYHFLCDGFNSVANTCQAGNIFPNVRKVNMTNTLETNTYRCFSIRPKYQKNTTVFPKKTTYKKHMHAIWLQIVWPSCPLSKHWVSLHEMMNAKRYLYPSHHQTSRQTTHGNVRGRTPNVAFFPRK